MNNHYQDNADQFATVLWVKRAISVHPDPLHVVGWAQNPKVAEVYVLVASCKYYFWDYLWM